MSREIKFRAWHKDARRNGEGSMLFPGDEFGTKHPLDCCRYAQEGQPVELMQYTGLKDKNGVEIYEGDLIEHTRSLDLPRVVKFFEGAFIAAGSSVAGNALINYDCARTIEVVGNIHQNPELLQ